MMTMAARLQHVLLSRGGGAHHRTDLNDIGGDRPKSADNTIGGAYGVRDGGRSSGQRSSSGRSLVGRGGVKRVLVLGVALLCACAFAGGGLRAAVAADSGMTLSVAQTDGTAPFDTSQGAGLDSGATNGIVRTNDTVTWSVSVTNDTAAQQDEYISVNVPSGLEITQIPSFCAQTSSQSGVASSLTPNPATNPNAYPDPKAGMTATTYQSLPAQRLVCYLSGNQQDASASTKFDFQAVVRPEVPNGTQLTTTIAVGSAATSGQDTNPTQETITVSAAPMYDVSKNGVYSSWDQGHAPIDYNWVSCTLADGTQTQCYRIYYYPEIFVNTPTGTNKGIAPASSFTFTDDLSSASFFGNPNIPANLGAYFVTAVAGNSNNGYPYSSMNGTTQTAANSVRNNGNVSCAQTGGPGTSVTCTVSGGDYSTWTYPSTNRGGSSIPANKITAATLTLVLYIPMQTFQQYGQGASNTLSYTNTITNFNATSIAGDTNIVGSDPTANNSFIAGNAVPTNVAGIATEWVVYPGSAGATHPYTGTYGMLAGPYQGGSKTGSGLVVPSQNIASMMSVTAQSVTDVNSNVPFVACETWDNSLAQLSTKTPASSYRWSGASGQAVWIADVGGVDVSNQVPSDLQVWYSSGGKVAAGQQCGDDDATWYSDPADVPGNDPTLAAQGIYTAVNLVRVGFTAHPGVTAVTYHVAINTQVVANAPVGTQIGTWISGAGYNGPSQSVASVIAADKWNVSSYVVSSNAGQPYGDRVTVSSPMSSVSKQVLQLATQGGAWTNGLTQVSTGQVREFRLVPSLSSPVPGAFSPDVVVEDCIPAGFVLLSSSVPFVTSPSAGSQLSCDTGAGQTYVEWDLGFQSTDDALPVITYMVRVSPAVAAGVYTNTAVIRSVGDISSLSLRTATQQVQALNPAGIYVEKQALKPVVQVNRAGQAKDESMVWEVSSFNIGPVGGKYNLDMIDVLPSNGVNPVTELTGVATSGSSYHGSLRLDSVVETSATPRLCVDAGDVVAGGCVAVYYTRVSASLLTTDPAASVNSTSVPVVGGALVANTVNTGTWSLVADPSLIPADATGVRFVTTGVFDVSQAFSFTVTMTGVGNEAGDVYVNSMDATVQTADAFNHIQSIDYLGPQQAPVNVVGALVGDFVWEDLNYNGLQDTGEPGVANVSVRLTGTDDLGNTVDVSTTTSANGGYYFEDLRASDGNGYTIAFTAPDGYRFTTANVGSDVYVNSKPDGSGVIPGVVLSAGQVNDFMEDAGLVRPGTVGDFVWSDVNNNGLQDAGEPGLPGIQVTLSGTDGAGNAVSVTTTTDSDGKYVFTGVLPGSYTVSFSDPTRPAGSFVFSPQTQGSDTAVDSNADSTGVTASFTVVSNETNTTIDAGIHVLVPAITLEKTGALADGAQGVAGDVVTWSYTITNTGESVLDDVGLDDPMQGLSAITFGAWPDPDHPGVLAPGESVTASATYTLTETDQENGVVTNTATTTGTDHVTGTLVSDTDTARVPTVMHPKLTLVKTAKLADGATGKVGDTIDYTFTITNTGDISVHDVQVDDPMPGLTPLVCVWPDENQEGVLLVGQSATCTASYVITQADVDNGQVVNTATATSHTPGTPITPPSRVTSPPSSARIPLAHLAATGNSVVPVLAVSVVLATGAGMCLLLTGRKKKRV